MEQLKTEKGWIKKSFLQQGIDNFKKPFHLCDYESKTWRLEGTNEFLKKIMLPDYDMSKPEHEYTSVNFYVGFNVETHQVILTRTGLTYDDKDVTKDFEIVGKGRDEMLREMRDDIKFYLNNGFYEELEKEDKTYLEAIEKEINASNKKHYYILSQDNAYESAEVYASPKQAIQGFKNEFKHILKEDKLKDNFEFDVISYPDNEYYDQETVKTYSVKQLKKIYGLNKSKEIVK